ncbi:ral guanine nucleotide dissociation stimulator-like [Tamandua tetradactyla]|uniref:ral guanine nucleotide dissociation stimulator-like n=1 Tax=Tamandua tetradactyla TaxID=48850 RepID=UPI004053F71F
MVAAVEDDNQASVSLLMFHYRPFLSTQQVLDRVSKRYGDSCTLHDKNGGGQECLKNIFSCLLLTWLHEFLDDFCEPPDFPSLKQLVAFAQMALPGSALERQTQVLLSELEPSGPSETQTQGSYVRPRVSNHYTAPSRASSIVGSRNHVSCRAIGTCGSASNATYRRGATVASRAPPVFSDNRHSSSRAGDTSDTTFLATSRGCIIPRSGAKAGDITCFTSRAAGGTDATSVATLRPKT